MAKRRSNGDGSIRKRGKSYQATTPPPRRSKTFESHADAVSWLREQRSIAGDIESTPATLRDFFNMWLTDVKRERSANTYSLYHDTAEAHILPDLGARQIQLIRPIDVRNWIAGKPKLKGQRILQTAFEVLRRGLRAAVALELIPRDPTLGIARPGYQREEIDPYSAEEAAQILSGAAEHRLCSLFVVGFSTGMRQAELFGLHWDDIDFEDSVLRIRRTAPSTKGKVVIKEPKTAAGRRTIRLTPKCIESLEDRQRRRLAEGHAAVPIVFPAPQGNYNRKDTFRQRVWKPLLESVGVRYRGAHHMRHTFATLQLGAGVPVHVVSEILGHASVSTTLDIYAHAIPDQQQAAVESASRLFG